MAEVTELLGWVGPPKTHLRWGSGHSVSLNTPEIDWHGVPEKFWGRVSAICRSHSECLDLNHWFGDENFEPDLPILILIPDGAGGVVYNQIDCMGLAPVYELRDQSVAVWELLEERVRRSGSVVDFDTLREKHNLMRREDVDAAVREAFMDRIRRHKANPVTDPVRQVRYPNPTQRKLFQQYQSQDWKKN